MLVEHFEIEHLQPNYYYRGHPEKVTHSQNLYWSAFTVSEQVEIS